MHYALFILVCLLTIVCLLKNDVNVSIESSFAAACIVYTKRSEIYRALNSLGRVFACNGNPVNRSILLYLLSL